MPELPEVEVVRRGLQRHVVGHCIRDVKVLHPRAVRRQPGGSAGFTTRVAGRAIREANRRGKYLWLPLDSGEAILAHLGMSGQLLVQSPGAPDERHLRVRFMLSNDSELRFVDQRTFGGLMVCPLAGSVPAQIAHVALDPLDSVFDDVGFAAGLRLRRTGVKRALLDQTLVSGVGNIYADEALWDAKLHYATATQSLGLDDALRLLAALRAVMSAALEQGGTSFDSLYVNVNGESGYFDRSLRAYGQQGRPCRRCGTAIEREPFMSRSSYRCPGCQPVPPRPHW